MQGACAEAHDIVLFPRSACVPEVICGPLVHNVSNVGPVRVASSISVGAAKSVLSFHDRSELVLQV